MCGVCKRAIRSTGPLGYTQLFLGGWNPGSRRSGTSSDKALGAFQGHQGDSEKTGVQVGELLTLRWMAVDLKNCMLRVKQSVCEGRIRSPKSEGGLE